MVKVPGPGASVPGVCSPKTSCPNGCVRPATVAARARRRGQHQHGPASWRGPCARARTDLTETDPNDRQAAINPSTQTPPAPPTAGGRRTCRGGHMERQRHPRSGGQGPWCRWTLKRRPRSTAATSRRTRACRCLPRSPKPACSSGRQLRLDLRRRPVRGRMRTAGRLSRCRRAAALSRASASPSPRRTFASVCAYGEPEGPWA